MDENFRELRIYKQQWRYQWSKNEKNQHIGIKVQESPAVADKPARRESMPKIAPIRRA